MQPSDPRPSMSCLLLGTLIAAAPVGLGAALLALAHFFGDVTARNQATGNSEPIGPVLNIVGGVFLGLGVCLWGVALCAHLFGKEPEAKA